MAEWREEKKNCCLMQSCIAGKIQKSDFARYFSKCVRACLTSSDEDGDERKGENLSGDQKFRLTILPKPSEFVEPAVKTLYHLTAGQNNKFV